MDGQRTSSGKHPLRKWPGYLLALFTDAKSFRDNPVIGNALLNRLGLHVLRVVIGHGVLRFRWLLLSPWVAKEDRRSFYRQGYIVKENFLTPQQLAELRAFFAAQLPMFRQMRQVSWRAWLVSRGTPALRYAYACALLLGGAT